MTLRYCLLCGIESNDVGVSLVEFRPEDQRIVDVRVPVTHREGAVEMVIQVRERFGALPRCRDHRACADRVAALAVVPTAEPEATEPSWLG